MTRHRSRRPLLLLVALPVVFMLASSAAWAYWSGDSVAGGSGASAAISVNAGATPAASVAGRSVTVSWDSSTLSNGSTAVTGYVLGRFDSTGTTGQSMASCTATLATTTCTETGVPAGSWTYRVVPLFGTNWRGPASATSNIVVVEPIAGSVRVTGLTGTASLYSTSTTLRLTLEPGTDAAGPVTGTLLDRQTASLANGLCGSFGGFTLVATDPPASTTNSVADQACHQYRYVVVHGSGAASTYTSTVVKVDTTAPSTPTFVNVAGSNSYWNAGAMYYRSAGTGSFRTTATATDAAAGIAGYTFGLPASSNWSSTPGALGGTTYAWSAGATGTSASATAFNNAGTASASASFTLTADNTAPSGGSGRRAPPTGAAGRGRSP